ncbi:C-Type Lectin Domain Family 4 Member D [Manis pentadactyla]|nr:C-Type Lectin Domain Family 4 Member D [Manis pentadactyla]
MEVLEAYRCFQPLSPAPFLASDHPACEGYGSHVLLLRSPSLPPPVVPRLLRRASRWLPRAGPRDQGPGRRAPPPPRRVPVQPPPAAGSARLSVTCCRVPGWRSEVSAPPPVPACGARRSRVPESALRKQGGRLVQECLPLRKLLHLMTFSQLTES